MYELIRQNAILIKTLREIQHWIYSPDDNPVSPGDKYWLKMLITNALAEANPTVNT